MGAEGTDLWCTCGVCLSASVLSAREGVREGSLRGLQLGRCGAGGIEGTARILRPCFLCARGGGLHAAFGPTPAWLNNNATRVDPFARPIVPYLSIEITC